MALSLEGTNEGEMGGREQGGALNKGVAFIVWAKNKWYNIEKCTGEANIKESNCIALHFISN